MELSGRVFRLRIKNLKIMATKKTNASTKTKKKSGMSVEGIKPASGAEKVEINELFMQALARHKNEVLQDKKQKHKEIDHLTLMTEEYLSCFSIIGYTLQGEQVCVFNANNPRDEAALVDLLRATFVEIVSNRP